MPDDNNIDLDVIMEELGSFGRFQVEMFLYLTFPIVVKAIYNTQYVFAAGQTDYRCRVPICESVPEKYEPGPWGKFALPKGKSNCYRKKIIGTTCEASSFSNEIEKCDSWVYENDYSIVHEFNLACQEWKRTTVGTMHSFAYFTALPAIAYFSDVWGRGRVLIWSAIGPAFFGVGRAFVNNYYVYLILEYFESFTGCGTYSSAFILGLEMVSVNNRVKAGNLLAAIFAVGQSFSGVIASYVPYWRSYTLVIYPPSFIFFSYFCIYKESLRWLVAKGYKEKATNVILKAAKMNNMKLSMKTMATLTYQSEVKRVDESLTGGKQELAVPTVKKKPLWRQVLKSKTLLFRLSVCSYSWVTMSLVYYGLSINSVSLAGSRYTNFCISSLIEIPGNILSALTLDRFGRKSAICCANFICGLSLVSTGFLSNGKLITVLTMLGKLCISMISCSIYIYTIELFPTEARHSLLSVCSMCGRIGAMLAPQTPLLMQSSKTLPNVIFGVMTTIAGMLIMLQPETLRMKLPDTISQAENLKMMPRTLRKTDALSGEDNI